MCAELGLPDGVREGSDELGAFVFRGEVDKERVSGSAESDGAQEFFPNAEDASVLCFGISLKPLGARSLCVHKVSLEAISVGIGEMSKFGGI
jgi:hypothetical protein